MSEIICPFCGFANSIEALTCSNCKKQLYDDVDPDSSPPARDEMDWLNDFRGFDNDRSAGPEKKPDASLPGETPSSADAEGEDDIPEWLARIRALKQEDASEPEKDEPAEAEITTANTPTETELPDWIKEIKEGDVPQPLEEPPGDLPDWLRSMAVGEEIPPADDISPDLSMILDEPGAEGGIRLPDIPDDLSVEAEPDGSLETANLLPDDETESLVDIPDDLFEAIVSQPEAVEAEAVADEEPPAAPEWMESEKAETVDSEISAEMPQDDGQLPEWMFEPGEAEASPAAEPAELDFSTLDASLAAIGAENLPAGQPEAGLPDWLLDDEAGNFGTAATQAGESPNLEIGQMPGWLHAMQPLEAAAPEVPSLVDENRIEPTGPLAGYQGVLPGEGVVTQYSRPPVYSGGMQVTDKQRIYATLFDTLIADESRVGVPAADKSSTLQMVLRLVVGLILIGALLIVLIFNPGLAPSPNLVPPEAVVFYEAVQTLTSADSPPRILLGLDYEPSLSGELSTIASPMIQDWMAVNSGLAFVSLNLSGPALSQELVELAAAGAPDYLTAERVINLGYLPGGASALAALAADPSRAAPASVDGIPAWNSLLLQGMVSLSDFDAIILLTDNTENTRAWIEQVKPAVADTPLLVVSSAQAAPALMPYVQSGQIAGMISGFTGGAAYEQLTQAQNGPVRGFWDAYQGGMLLIAAFMLIGSLSFGIMNLVHRLKKA